LDPFGTLAGDVFYSRELQLTVQEAKVIPLVEPWFPSAYADSVRDQVLTGFLGPGQRTQEFAKGLASFAGSPHCLLTVSGTVALSVAAKALGLKAGDEIVVPAYGVISTINAFASIGLEPKLADVDHATGCISVQELEKAVSAKTRAVCFVNFSGYTGPNLVDVKQFCDEKGLPLIEDAACALGHSYGGVSAGLRGTVGIYSFSVPKVLTTGQGGAIVTADSAVFAKAGAFIDQGDLEWRKTNINRDVGSNLRYNDILAAFGLCQLNDLPERLQRRRAAYQSLCSELEGKIFTVPGNQAPLHNIVFAKQPDLLVEKLKAQGIFASRQYRTLSQHPAYRHLADRTYPNADHWTDHAVYLPFGMALTPEDAKRIAEALIAAGVELLYV